MAGSEPSDPEPLDSTACAQWTERNECRETLRRGLSFLQSNDAKEAVDWLKGAVATCSSGGDPSLLARAQAYLAQARAGQPAAPQPSNSAVDGSKPYYTVNICNRADGPLSVALDIADDPVSRLFMVHGWWTIPQGQCQNLVNREFGTWNSARVYIHAHTHDETWPAKARTTTSQCLSNRGTGEAGLPSSRPCSNGDELFPFYDNVVNRENELLNKDAPMQTIYRQEFH